MNYDKNYKINMTPWFSTILASCIASNTTFEFELYFFVIKYNRVLFIQLQRYNIGTDIVIITLTFTKKCYDGSLYMNAFV